MMAQRVCSESVQRSVSSCLEAFIIPMSTWLRIDVTERLLTARLVQASSFRRSDCRVGSEPILSLRPVVKLRGISIPFDEKI